MTEDGLPRGEYYPGFDPVTSTDLPAELARPLTDADLSDGWQLDFHYPRGILPLSHELLAIVNHAAQQAADAMPVPVSHGLAARLVGPHVYTGGVPVASAGERADRAAAASPEIARYHEVFAEQWTRQARELDAAYRRVEDLDGALSVFADGWRLHFDVMYRLLAVIDNVRAVCTALGVPEWQVAALLPAGETAVLATDRELWQLAARARGWGLLPLFRAHEQAAALADAISGERRWCTEFESFLRRRGQRTDAVLDVGEASWAEDPTRPLMLIRSILLGGSGPPRQAAAATEQIRSRLAAADRRVFDNALDLAQKANFAWWNEEHNVHIDLRLHLPIRAAGRALAARLGGAPDDGLLLFVPELRELAAGRRDWADVTDLIASRRSWRAAWLERRAGLPRAIGAGHPDTVDPVMREVIGAPTVAGPQATMLLGLPASRGIARGHARIVAAAHELARAGSGDVLVCEATSPSWTPAFTRLAACVCDSGGALTHAAIICREYGLPCVCAVGVATRLIRDGDLVEVNGTAGTVTILR